MRIVMFFCCVLFCNMEMLAQDTLWWNCINVMDKPPILGAEKWRGTYFYENMPTPLPIEQYQVVYDRGKSIWIDPPKEGEIWIALHDRDSVLQGKKKFTVIAPPLPSTHLFVGNQAIDKKGIKIFRHQKLRFLWSFPTLTHPSDMRITAAKVQIALYKDYTQPNPTKTETINLTGIGNQIEIDFSKLALKDIFYAKVIFEEVQRVNYNERKTPLNYPKKDLTYFIQFQKDTAKIIPPKSPSKPTTATPPPILPSDIAYYADELARLPLVDEKVITPDREPICLNQDSVIRAIRFNTINKHLQTESNLQYQLLIDEKGRCQQYILTKQSHIAVNARANSLVSYLRFLPAQRNGKNIKRWTNLTLRLRQ